MRRTQMVLGLVLLLVGAWPANAQQKVLYQAPVTVSQAEVRSGPSDKPEMYVTSCLGQGQVVQVVEELEGGWLAIVPPAGSCSYVNSRFLQKTSSPYIWTVVTHEDAPVRVRIGSLCKVDQRSVQGPPLQRGAQVIATGAPNTYDQEGEWVQIRWVTGEKRYIRKEAIAKAAPAAPLKPVPAVTASAEEKEPTTLPPVPKARPAVSNNTAKKDSNLAPLPEGHPVTPVPVTAPDSSKVSPSPLEAHPAVKPPPPPVVNPAPVASSQVDPLLQMQQEAQELERANDLVKASQRYAELGARVFQQQPRLGHAVLQPRGMAPKAPSQWRCEHGLFRGLPTDASFLSRPGPCLHRTISIRRRPVTRIRPLLLRLPARLCAQVYSGAKSSGPGRLRPANDRLIDSRRAYYLESSQGQVLMYVTVAPGMNLDLDRYVDCNVELFGNIVPRGDIRPLYMSVIQVKLLGN